LAVLDFSLAQNMYVSHICEYSIMPFFAVASVTFLSNYKKHCWYYGLSKCYECHLQH